MARSHGAPLPDEAPRPDHYGDFSEEVLHDSSFVCDGLVDALCLAYAGTWWAAAVTRRASLAQALKDAGSGRDDERLRSRLGAG